MVRFTSAQLAEQAFAAAHRCAGDSAASSSSSSSRSSSWVGESGKDGPVRSLPCTLDRAQTSSYHRP